MPLVLLAWFGLTSLAQAAEPAKIFALFLGDPQIGHHEPAKRYAWIKPKLEQAGIAVAYTDKMADLNAANLAKYDVLMVYANIATITADQEKAVLDFVNAGHGFVPIHCASACFGNSPAMIRLMGGRFARHETKVFAPVIVNHAHPIMAGFRGYETWDETYVHDQHNTVGRTVLAIRDENGSQEPWTWVRQQGQGRVFYTASGHDERTWTNANFQELIVRGVAWAAAAKGQGLMEDVTGHRLSLNTRAPLQYEPRPTVQNYEHRPQQPLYQLPLSPKDSASYIEVESDFKFQLFASEPEIVKPIAINWDHRGRLWVLETVDYPSIFTEPWQGHDKLVICEDTDGDGKADKFTTFFEGLNIPTGFTFVNGGVLVAQAPNLIFLKDTDGDDRADVKQVIMGGWSKGDTHAGPSNLKYGFDNQIYGCVGYSGFVGNVGGEHLDFRMGPWRLARDYKKMEFLGQYNNNTWGFGFNEAGELFGSTANNAHHFYTPIPIPLFKSVQGLETDEKAQRSVKMDAHYAAHPITDKIRQVDVQGGYTAAAGNNIYTARDYPEKYWNVCALVNEPTMHLVHQGFLKRDGSGWTEAGDGMNLFAGEDEWIAPVHAEVGPDGAVWVADWYNFIIQHNPTPSREHGGFDTTTGKGGAHVNPLRDSERGRIYRVVYKNAATHPRITLDPADGQQLVATLKNDNLFWRLTAQRLLVERAKTDVVPALLALARDQSVDAVGINGGVIHALWTLQGLNQLDGANVEATAVAVAGLRHPSPAVRRNATQVLAANGDSATALAASGILHDKDLNVRLAAILAAAKMPPSDQIGAQLFAQIHEPETVADKYLPTAIKIAAAHHAQGFLAAEIKSGTKFQTHSGEDSALDAANLAPNPGFEKVTDGKPEGWASHVYQGKSEFNIVPGGRTGNCAEITSTEGGDTGWLTRLRVKPHFAYRLTGWIKTKNLKGATGALFNLNANPAKSRAVTGTTDWTRITMDFDSEDSSMVEINCLYGGWGTSTGTAWYDDVTVVEVGPAARQGGVGSDGEFETLIARNAGHKLALADQLRLLATLGTADPGLTGAILDGLAFAWAEQPAPAKMDEGARSVLQTLALKLTPNNQRRLAILAQSWSLREGLPGLAGQPPAVPVSVKSTAKPLSAEEQVRFDSGKARYMLLCIACHQPNGMGLAALAPPLVNSEWVNGSEQRLIRMTLDGLKGPVTAAGVTFNLNMPAWREALDDTALAEILTFVRHEWGNDSAPVQAATVAAVRAREKDRTDPWTVDELQRIAK